MANIIHSLTELIMKLSKEVIISDFLKLFFTFIIYVGMCTHMYEHILYMNIHIYEHIQVKVRGQLAGINFFSLYHMGTKN